MSKWVILTGGIGSGKSTVAHIFQEFGVPVIDTDAISKMLTQSNGEALDQIQKEFGDESVDFTRALNRKFIRKMIFADPKAKEKLENILHPMIFCKVCEEQKKYVESLYGLLDVPLFHQDSEYYKISNRVLVVDCEKEVQISRVIRRNQFTREETLRIIDSQLSRKNRLQLADDVIKNNSTLEFLYNEVVRKNNFYVNYFNLGD